MRAEVLRTLVNAGHLAPGETRHPTDEIYRLSGDDALTQLLLEGRSYVGLIDDPGLHSVERSLLERLAVRSCAAVPIMLGDVAWGELWATRGGRHAGFDKHDLRLLNAIAGQLAAGIARAELYGRLAELAFEDKLTGLANRSALHERLELAFELVAAGSGRGDAAPVRRRQPQAAQRPARAPRRRLGAQGGGDARCAPRPRRFPARSCAG